MRVLQLGKYYSPYSGGIENHLQMLCEEIRGHVDLDVVVANSKLAESDEMVNGVHVHRCAEIAKVASTSICPTMVAALSMADYDIVHIHYPNPVAVMSYLASRKPRHHKVVVTYHSDIVKQKTLLLAYRPFMNLVMNHASAIICTSPNYLASSRELDEHHDRCVVLPYGIDITRFAMSTEVDDEAARVRARYGGQLLLATGRLIYYKGFEHAIVAMRDIDAKLLIAGTGPLEQALRSLAHEQGVEDRVYFLGDIPNEKLAVYYRACDVFVLPSIARSEAFAIVQLEAMACERPVVNTQLDSGVPFVSRHEESGLTVPPEDPRALAAAINRLLADDAWRKALGQRGRARVEAEFTKEKMAASTLAIYEQALGKRTTAS